MIGFNKDCVEIKGAIAKIDAEGIYYRDLNTLLRNLNGNGVTKIELYNVCGQRYIGTDLAGDLTIEVHGTPGNDLGAFMRGPNIEVYGNAQDGCGNTMDEGKIVIHGHAGDIVGYSMRGGNIFIRDDVGYRAGIHMKEYQEKKPIIVVGGSAQDFCGEYMAGGILVILGLTLGKDAVHDARFVGTGMHGGKMYVRGKVKNPAKDIEVIALDDEDKQLVCSLVSEFCDYFDYNKDEIMAHDFSKLIPVSKRPYGNLYTV
jgi:glutamate synthase domain-containing protein 3